MSSTLPPLPPFAGTTLPVSADRAALSQLETPPGYEIHEPLGQGGMGIVFKARQISLDRLVALKCLRAELADDSSRARFRREAEAIAQVNHPGIVQVHEVGEHHGVLFFSMEYISGGSLADRLRQGPIGFTDAAHIVAGIARAVGSAHAASIVHRDLKPANILLVEGASAGPITAKVSDFGLARRLEKDQGATQAGAIVGTPSYMAPEQAQGTAIGPTADVYSLGAVLFECLTGRPPFLGETILDTLAQVLHQDPVPPSQLRAQCPRDLETICLRCLHKDPSRRYQSASALADDLGRYLAGEPIHARPVGLLERAVKWARRQPALAGMLALIAVVLVGATVAASALANLAEQNRRSEYGLRIEAERAWEAEQEQRHEAEKGRAREQTLRGLAERTLYINRLAFAHREIDLFNSARADELLDLCPKDLRQWEWRHLKSRCRVATRVLAITREPIHHLTISPDGKLLALGIGNPINLGQRAVIELRDADTLALVRSFKGEGGGFPEVDFGRDGKELIGVCLQVDLPRLLNDKLRLEQVSSCQTLQWDASGQLQMVRRGISALSWSHDGKLVADARVRTCEVTVRDANNEDLPARLRTSAHPGIVTQVRFSPDDRWLLTNWQQANTGKSGSSFQQGLMVWDLKTGKTHWKRDEALGAAFSPNGKLLALSSVAGVIELWDVAEQRLVGKLTGHAGQCGWLGFKEISGRLLLASTGSDRTIRVWDVESQRGLLTLSGHGAGVTCVAFSKSGDRLFSSSQDGTLRVWGLSFDGGFRRYPIKYQPGQGLVFLDKDLLVVPGSDGGFLNLRTHKQTALPGSPRAVAFARSAGLLAVSSTNAIVLYDTKKRDGDGLPQRRGQMATEKGEMACLALNEPADRVYLVRKMLHAGVIDSFLEARVVPTGELQWSTRLDGLATILHLAVSPDGKVLATASLAGAIELRDPLTGQVTKKLLPSSTDAGVFVALRSVAFSPDGKLLAAGTGNGARAGERPDVYLWDLKTYAPRRLRGHDALIAGVAFAPDGKRLATASIDFNRGQSGEVKLWDVETGEEMLTLPGAMAVAFTADDQRLAAFAYEEFNRPVVRVWEAFAEKEIKQKEEGEEEKASPP